MRIEPQYRAETELYIHCIYTCSSNGDNRKEVGKFDRGNT